MKKLSLTLSALLGGALLLGGLIMYLPLDSNAFAETESSVLEKYVNEEKRYTIEYPKEWQKQDMPRLDIVLFSPDKTESSQTHATINIVSEQVGDSVTLDQFYTESVKHLTTELHDVHVENSGEQSIDRVPGKWILYDHVMLKNRFAVLQYFFVANGYIYLLTFSSPYNEYKKYSLTFENMAASFRLLKDS